MRLGFVALLPLVSACQSVQFDSASQSVEGDGIYIRKVKVYEAKPLVCYSEIRNDSLLGVSCQNHLGITEFSVGVQAGRLVTKKITPMVSQAQIQTVIDVLTLALFEQVGTSLSQRYRIQKNDKKVLVKTSNKRLAEVSQ